MRLPGRTFRLRALIDEQRELREALVERLARVRPRGEPVQVKLIKGPWRVMENGLQRAVRDLGSTFRGQDAAAKRLQSLPGYLVDWRQSHSQPIAARSLRSASRQALNWADAADRKILMRDVRLAERTLYTNTFLDRQASGSRVPRRVLGTIRQPSCAAVRSLD